MENDEINLLVEMLHSTEKKLCSSLIEVKSRLESLDETLRGFNGNPGLISRVVRHDSQIKEIQDEVFGKGESPGLSDKVGALELVQQDCLIRRKRDRRGKDSRKSFLKEIFVPVIVSLLTVLLFTYLSAVIPCVVLP